MDFSKQENGTTLIPSGVSNMLSIIKIIAAVVVLLGHGFSFFGISIFKDTKYFPHIQSLAVLVFLIVSGFLTDDSLHRKSGMAFPVYIKQRTVRVFSYFLPALLLIALLDAVWIRLEPSTYTYSSMYTLETLVRNILMLPRLIPVYFPNGKQLMEPIFDLLQTETFASGRPLWTLFIEWWLWIFYGYFILVHRAKRNKVITYTDTLVLILFVYEVFHLDNAGQCLVLCFFLGVVIRRSYQQFQGSKAQLTVLLLCSIIIWIVAGMCTRNAYSLVMCVTTAMMIGVIILIANQSKKSRKRNWLKILSDITFPLYLLHYSVIELVRHCFAQSSATSTMMYSILLSIVTSVVFYLLVKIFGFAMKKAIVKTQQGI